MDEQDRDLDMEELDDRKQADTGIFYWALKAALERTPMETPASMGQ